MAQTQVIDSRFAAESASFTREVGKTAANQRKELLKIAAYLIALKVTLEDAKSGGSAPKAPRAGASAPKAPAAPKKAPAEGGRVNPLLLLYEAVGRSQDSESQQQITDSKTTEADVARLQQIYYWWNERPIKYDGHTVHGQLGRDAAEVASWAAGGKSDAGNVSAWQTKFNEDSSNSQAIEGQVDGAVQSGQNQTSGDASNNQKITQMIGTINSILSTTAQMLAQGIQ